MNNIKIKKLGLNKAYILECIIGKWILNDMKPFFYRINELKNDTGFELCSVERHLKWFEEEEFIKRVWVGNKKEFIVNYYEINSYLGMDILSDFGVLLSWVAERKKNKNVYTIGENGEKVYKYR